jgi:hypothetical protein
MSNAYLETMAKDLHRYYEIVSDYENDNENENGNENELDYWRITEYYNHNLNVRYEVTKKNGRVIEIRIMSGRE